MQHNDDETLRRSLENDRPNNDAHWQQCPQCRDRRNEMLANATFAKHTLEDSVPAVDVAAAYERLVMRGSSTAWSWPRGLAGLAVAAAVLLVLIFTPLGSRALQFLTIFEPQQFAPVAITDRDARQMRLVPYLRTLGTLRSQRSPERQVPDLVAARDLVDFSPRALPSVPPALRNPVRYTVLPPSVVTFTFSAAKTRAYELRDHRALPPMPPGLDGTIVRVETGWALVTTYGNIPKDFRSAGHRFAEALVFAQARVPRATSTGASVATLENYLLSMPNMPPDVSQQLRAIIDPQTTLPVPFRIDRQQATTVDVDGVRGLAIGDQTGLGSSVMWQKSGIIYFIAGPLKQSDILDLANTLE